MPRSYLADYGEEPIITLAPLHVGGVVRVREGDEITQIEFLEITANKGTGVYNPFVTFEVERERTKPWVRSEAPPAAALLSLEIGLHGIDVETDGVAIEFNPAGPLVFPDRPASSSADATRGSGPRGGSGARARVRLDRSFLLSPTPMLLGANRSTVWRARRSRRIPVSPCRGGT
jgi:hypothetical protein